jgi:hypothetical protein
MATKLGVNATKIAANPQQLVEQSEQNGRLHVMYDEYSLTADVAANDIIKMGPLLPKGARVLDVICDSPDLDAQSAGALTVGWAASPEVDSGGTALVAADDDGFITTMDVHTAGKTSAMSGALVSANPGKFKKFAGAVQVQVKISGETDATSGTIRCAVYYTFD